MTTPQANEGEQEAAYVDVTMAMDLIERALSAFGSESAPGKAMIGALSILSKEFAAKRDRAADLKEAEIMQLVSATQPSPEMAAMKAPAPGGPPQMPMGA